MSFQFPVLGDDRPIIIIEEYREPELCDAQR